MIVLVEYGIEEVIFELIVDDESDADADDDDESDADADADDDDEVADDVDVSFLTITTAGCFTGSEAFLVSEIIFAASFLRVSICFWVVSTILDSTIASKSWTPLT